MNIKTTLLDINLIYNYSHLNGILKFLSYFKSQFLLIYLVLIGKPDCIHFQWFKVPILDYIIVFVLKILLPVGLYLLLIIYWL